MPSAAVCVELPELDVPVPVEPDWVSTSPMLKVASAPRFRSALLLVAYIQPFVDGNKRTSRLVANAILIAHGVCPVSFRTVAANDYRAALLLFYEQNNLSAFKRIFLDQVAFAVREYF